MAGLPASHPVVFADPLPRVTRVSLPIITPPPFDGDATMANPFSLPAQLPGRAPRPIPRHQAQPFHGLGGVSPHEIQGFPSSEG